MSADDGLTRYSRHHTTYINNIHSDLCAGSEMLAHIYSLDFEGFPEAQAQTADVDLRVNVSSFSY